MRAAVVVLLVQVCLGQWTFDPSTPIVNLPFRVTTTVQVSSLFVSSSLSCSDVATGGSATLLSGGAAVFQIVSQNASTFFFCDSQTYVSLTSMAFVKLSIDPRYAIRNQVSHLVFPAFTPNGTMALLEYSDCTGGIGGQQALSASKTIDVAFATTGFYFVCLTFFSSVVSRQVTTNIGSFVVTDPSSFTPQSAITYQTLSFEISGAAPPNTRVFFSVAATCNVTSQGPFQATGTFGKSVSTRILLPGGNYTFCVEIPIDSGVYVPSGTLTIGQYSVRPLTAYAGKPTMYNARFNMQNVTSAVALASSSSCPTPFIAVATPVDSMVNWTLTAGTYYSCVYNSATQAYIFASQHSVVQSPSVTFSTQAVRSLPLSVQSSVPSIVLGDMANPTIIFNLTNGAATQLVPPTSPSSLTIWVPTPDYQFWYDFGQLAVRDFSIIHPPIFAGEPSVITVDGGSWSGYQLRFSTTTACVDGENLALPILNRAVTLNISGNRIVCINGSQFGFQPAADATVFDVPTLSPSNVLANKTTIISIFRVPPGQAVTFGKSCSNTQASFLSSGAVSSVSFSSPVGVTTFCSTYAGSTSLFIVRTIGAVTSLAVSIRPAVQVVNTLSTYVLTIDDSTLLANLRLFVGADCSQSSTSSPIVQGNGVISASLTPTVIGASLQVCVGNSTQGFVSIGQTGVVPPFDVSYTTAIAGLPFQLSIIGSSFQPQQYVISSTRNCSGATYATGTLTSGVATVRLALPLQYFACGVSDDGITLLQGGEVVVGTFSAVTTTLVRLYENQIAVTSSVAGASFFLSSYSNCSGIQYVLSPVLSAPSGLFTACQTSGGFSSGSTNLVRVVDQFVASTPTNVKAYVPFVVNLTRGDLGTRPDVSVFLTLTNCSGSPIASFTSANVNMVTITIPTLAFVPSFLCIRSADGVVTSQIADFSPLPYMSPTTVASTVPVGISSGARQSGFGIVSPTSSCGVEWMSPVPIQLGVATVTVPRSSASLGYYCESDVSSQFQLRGVLSVIQLSNGTDQEVIRNQTSLPGVPIVANINTSVVSDPFFSTTSSCSPRVDLSTGYLPAEGENAYFFVCVLSADQTLRFTTQYPSVHVVGYTIQPKAFAGGSQQSFILSSALPSQTNLKLSSLSSCENNVSSASATGMIGTVVPSTVLDGIYYLCATRSGLPTSIATLLVSRSPQEVTQTLVIPNVPLCIGLQSTSTTFSLVNNANPAFDSFRAYYSSDNRSIFFSGTTTSCSAGIGVLGDATPVTTLASVCLATLGAVSGASYQLCIGAPSGFVSLGNVVFSSVSVQPANLVAGGSASLTFTNMPSTSFALSTSSTCSSSSTPLYSTNSSGIAASFKASFADNSFLPAGTYFICMVSPTSTMVSVGNVSVSRASFYSISNSAVVQQVPTQIDLMDDLTASALLGLRTTPTCAVASGLASITSIDTTSISITGTTPGVAYLCAVTPINNTVVVVAAISISAVFAQYTSQASTCTEVTVGLNAPGIYTSLTLVAADYCCGRMPANVLSTAAQQSASQRRFVVTDDDLEQYSPRVNFALCASNASSCYNLGQISFVASSCAGTPAPQTPAPGNNNGNNGSNSIRQDLAASSTQEKSKDITPTIILAAVFALLLIIVVIIIIVQCCLRSRRVIPADLEDGKARDGPDNAMPAENEWKRTFDSIVSTNKRGINTSVTLNQLLHVPISMRLDSCREAPIPIQMLELQERDARASLSEIERNTNYRLIETILTEMQEMREYHAAQEKTRVLQNVSVLLHAEYMSLAELEEANRTEIMDEEEGYRITVVDHEKQLWRRQVDLEGQRLKDTLERDPFWRNRRRLLREAHMRAMQSVQASPAAYDPTPNRTVMVDQTELESRYSKEQDLYI